MYREQLTAFRERIALARERAAARARARLRRFWYRNSPACIHRPRTEDEFGAVMERVRPGDVVVIPYGNDWNAVAPALSDGVTFHVEPGVVALAIPMPLRQQLWN